MKHFKLPLLVITILSLGSCEDTVVVDLGESTPAIVIDAWIDNRPDTQTIKLTMSRSFYEEAEEYESVEASSVIVENITDPSERTYVFEESVIGTYTWIPEFDGDAFGIIGNTYRLTINVGEHQFEAFSELNPVAPVDSMKFIYEEATTFFDEFYYVEFYATDLEGPGTNYWVKGFYNDIFLSQPEFIITSVDGAFSEVEDDGKVFIVPIRASINPDLDYEFGDNIGVELHGISEEALRYLNEISTQTDREGGIGELFSVPMTNLSGNITTMAGNEDALGFFSTSSVSISDITFTEDLALQAREEAE